MGFIALLTVLFIGLKLCEVIAWSWWLVLLPLWGSALFAGVLFLGAIFFNISKGTKKW